MPLTVSRTHRPPHSPPLGSQSLADILALLHPQLHRIALPDALLPPVCGQPSPAVAVHPGLQPEELSAAAMPAEGGQGLVPAEPSGHAHQDGGKAGAPCQAAGVPVGRGGRAASGVPGGAGTHWQVVSGAWLAEEDHWSPGCTVGSEW